MSERKKSKRALEVEDLTSEDEECIAKAVYWMGSSKKDLSRMAREVRQMFGYALFLAQVGEKHPDAKPMKGFGGAAKVMEVVADHESDTFRAMYTVRLGDDVFVLHCFKKKSTSGASTPKAEQEVIEQRLKDATELYKQLKKESKR